MILFLRDNPKILRDKTDFLGYVCNIDKTAYYKVDGVTLSAKTVLIYKSSRYGASLPYLFESFLWTPDEWKFNIHWCLSPEGNICSFKC